VFGVVWAFHGAIMAVQATPVPLGAVAPPVVRLVMPNLKRMLTAKMMLMERVIKYVLQDD